MRVIAGGAGGLRLVAPTGTRTRPTTDKVKGAIFGMLGNRGAEGRVLDLFAGSGGLGIEALSRGAEWCDFVDLSHEAIVAITSNLGRTNQVAGGRVVRADAARFLDAVDEPYDLILCDPPYAWPNISTLLAYFGRQTVTRPDAVVVIETGRRDPALASVGRLIVDRTRVHGDTAITIFRVA